MDHEALDGRPHNLTTYKKRERDKKLEEKTKRRKDKEIMVIT